MRSPRCRRHHPRTIYAPEDIGFHKLAERVRYVGSPEHKDFPSFAGHPRPRADASLCPRSINDQEMVTGWLRSAIRARAIGGLWEGDFPRYAWYKDGHTVYEARLVNKGEGEYKGYPLERYQWPKGIEDIYDSN